MTAHTVLGFLALTAGFASWCSPLAAQRAGAEPSLTELASALRAGKDVQFRIRYNSVAPDSPKDSKIYACCGNVGVYMADGTVTLNLSSVTFAGSVGSAGFSVPYDKLIESTLQPQGEAPRVHFRVMAKNRRDQEAPVDYYLYHPAAMAAGDAGVDGRGASIACNQCDIGAVSSLDFLIGVGRSAKGVPRVTSESASTAPPTMTNADVLKVVAAGLSDQIIVTSIQQAPKVRFDLSLAGLVALKNAKVPDDVILAMQAKVGGATAATAAPAAQEPKGPVVANPGSAAPREVSNGCEGIQNMGIVKNELMSAAMGGLFEWLLRIRNNSSVTRLVVFGWRDSNGQEQRAQVQIRAGDIATPRLDMTSTRLIAPVTGARLLSCQ